MRSGFARFLCWLLAIVSMLASLVILCGPILDPKLTALDFLKIPWCATVMFSPICLMLLFAVFRKENFKSNLLGILVPLTLMGLAIFFSITTEDSSSEQQLIDMFCILSVLFYVITGFCAFAAIINEDDNSSGSSGSSRDPIDDLIGGATGDEGYVDTTGLSP